MDIVLNTTKIVLASELDAEGIKRNHIAKRLNIGRATLYRWFKGINSTGSVEEFIDQYLVAKKGPRKKRKVNELIRIWVWDIREKNKDCCGQKIQYYLEKEKNVHLAIPTIYKILSEKYQLRNSWKKNTKRGPVPKANKPREVIQMDTVDLGAIFSFNSIDIYTKEADVVLRSSLTSSDGYFACQSSMKRRFGGYSDMIQTDGGPEYKDDFKNHVLEFTKRHRVARPYKKNEQSYIESFNRSLRKECVGWVKYRTKDLPMIEKEARSEN